MAITITRNEQSHFYLTASFVDKDGTAYTPTTVHWQMDAVGGANIVAATALSAATSIEWLVPATALTMVDAGSTSEGRVVTVTVDQGLGTEVNDVYEFTLTNLQGVS